MISCMYDLIPKDRETQDSHEIYVAVTNFNNDPAEVSDTCLMN